LLDVGLSNTEAFAVNALFTAGDDDFLGTDRRDRPAIPRNLVGKARSPFPGTHRDWAVAASLM